MTDAAKRGYVFWGIAAVLAVATFAGLAVYSRKKYRYA